MAIDIVHKLSRRDFLRLAAKGPETLLGLQLIKFLPPNLETVILKAGVLVVGALTISGCSESSQSISILKANPSILPGKPLDPYLNGALEPEESNDLPCGEPTYHCTYGLLDRYRDESGTKYQLLGIFGPTHTVEDRASIYAKLNIGDDGTGQTGFLSSNGITPEDFSLEPENVILPVHSCAGVNCVKWLSSDGKVLQMNLNNLSNYLGGSSLGTSQTGPGVLGPGK